MDNYLAATSEIDFHSDAIQEFMRDCPVESSLKDQAIWIYEKVRDGFLYDPYHLNISPKALKASVVLTKKRAWCVEKALVAVACFRKIGIPARFGFGIVKNHIGVDKLVSYLKKDEIVFHGFVEVFFNDKWIKCTPAFDKRICALNKVEPLVWDAANDSLFQAYRGDEKFMEYVHFYGSFATIPFDFMYAEMKKHYPHLFDEPINTKAFSFQF